MRVSHYEPGTQLAYDLTGVVPAVPGRVKLEVDKFVGGGFAGQVCSHDQGVGGVQVDGRSRVRSLRAAGDNPGRRTLSSATQTRTRNPYDPGQDRLNP